MQQEIYPETLTQAYRLVFGPLSGNTEDLNGLSLQVLKSAYRQKIKLKHPDKAAQLNVAAEILSEEFEHLTSAYEYLRRFVEARPRAFREMRGKKKPPPGTRPEGAPFRDAGPPPARPVKPSQLHSDFYYRGSLPRKPLRLGSYLYYSGIISWKQLVESIAWQRKHRQPMGEVAKNMGFLSPRDIAVVLYHVALGESFGGAARKLGKLNDEQIQAIIRTQQHRRLGDFFVEYNILSRNQIDLFVEELDRHNSTFGYHRKTFTI